MKATKKITVAVLILLMISLILGGCAPAAPTSEAAPSDSTSTAPVESEAPAEEPAETAELTDRAGNPFTAPESAEKIISMSPSITHVLVGLGLADSIIAIDTYSVGIEGLAADLPTYDMMAPEVESLAQLQPDVIFATGMSLSGGEDPYQAVIDLGAVMTYIPAAASIDDIKKDIEFIGEVTGKQAEAAAMITDMQTRIDAVVDTIGENESGKTVYFEISAQPSLYSFGTGTFLNEIIELLGCTNILNDQESWVGVSEEVILEKNPDVIFTNEDYLEDAVGDIKAREGWDAVTAVQNDEVYLINNNNSSQSNQNTVLAIEEMAKAMYPDLFE